MAHSVDFAEKVVSFSRCYPLPSLDDNGEAFRRVYFLRSSLRTLTEVYSAVSALRNNPDFRKLFRKYSQGEYDRLVAYIKALDKNLKELKRIRNALGGHVSKEGIQKALETIDFGESGKFEITDLNQDEWNEIDRD